MTQLTKIQLLHRPPLKKFRVKTSKVIKLGGKKDCVFIRSPYELSKSCTNTGNIHPSCKKAGIFTIYTLLKGKSVPWDPSAYADVAEKCVRKSLPFISCICQWISGIFPHRLTPRYTQTQNWKSLRSSLWVRATHKPNKTRQNNVLSLKSIHHQCHVIFTVYLEIHAYLEFTTHS